MSGRSPAESLNLVPFGDVTHARKQLVFRCRGRGDQRELRLNVSMHWTI